MPRFGPIALNDLISALRSAGFKGPYIGGRHQFMMKDDLKLVVSNPHRGEIGRPLLSEILRQAGIPRDEWEKL